MRSFIIGMLSVAVLTLPVYASAPYCPPVKSYGYQYYKPHVYYVPGYQVGSALREEAIAEKAANKAMDAMRAKYEAEMTALRGKFEAALEGKLTLEFGAKGSSSVNGEASGIQQIFNAHCVSCHEGPGAKKGLDLSDASRLTAAQLMKSALKVHLGTMPPAPADPVPQEQSEYLLKYAEQIK